LLGPTVTDVDGNSETRSDAVSVFNGPPPTIRSLTFILQDEFEDWRDGEMLIQSLLDTPEKVERAGRRQQELEQLALASGGIAGPGSLGEPAQEVSVA